MVIDHLHKQRITDRRQCSIAKNKALRQGDWVKPSCQRKLLISEGQTEGQLIHLLDVKSRFAIGKSNLLVARTCGERGWRALSAQVIGVDCTHQPALVDTIAY